MSNIGKQIISLPNDLFIKQSCGYLFIRGRLGIQHIMVPDALNIKVINQTVHVSTRDISCDSTMLWGSFRAHLNNRIIGVTKGFTYQLDLVGVGYRAEVINNKVVLRLGRVNDTKISIPEGIRVSILNGINITLFGMDKESLSLFCSKVRQIRVPDRYKGKGIRYSNEKLLLKEKRK